MTQYTKQQLREAARILASVGARKGGLKGGRSRSPRKLAAVRKNAAKAAAARRKTARV